MINIDKKTWREIDKEIARHLVQIRKRRKISQQVLSKRADVSLGTLKRFEQTGEISLKSLTKLANALEVEDELETLFAEVPFQSIEEILN